MNEKLDILQYLIENRAFASSASALALKLGYNGKMTIYRLMRGETRESKVNEVWQKIMDCFYLSETGLTNLAGIFAGAKELADLTFPYMNHNHPEWVKQLVLALVHDSYDYFPPKFQREVAPELKDLKADSPDVFWGIVTMLYIRGNAIDVYQGDVLKQASRIIRVLTDWLHGWFPENASAYIASAYLLNLPNTSNLWSILFKCILIFRYYTEPDFKNQAIQCAQLPFKRKRSYWHTPGSPYALGSEVWLLIKQNYERGANGFYVALRLKAGKDIQTFTLRDVLSFIFWTIDKEDDPPILQVLRHRGVAHEQCYYTYSHDEERQELHLEANPETGNLFDIPETLQMINMGHPNDKNEKIWARILSAWDEKSGYSVFQQAQEMLSGRIILKDYKLIDILVSRTSYTLFVDRQGKTVQYQLPLDAYDFLSKINPSQQVLFAKHTTDDEIYVIWSEFGYEIKLSEFIQVK